ncbi:MAG: hypothetical protein CVU03_08170 [Bacteroidetes bacterium HGW-Bacteroidetes-2]|jgi:hypothetical protein|nr:MAG: hypothetical protein CVU03_08170 [Bacteroidetes bacterium HGW-Bacteroidetes-2]
MQFIDAHKALIITVLLTGIFTLSIFSLKLSTTIVEEKGILINFLDEELLEEILEKQLQDIANNTSLETHKAFNEANNLSEKSPLNAAKTQTTEGKKSDPAERQKSVDELLLEELENERMLFSYTEEGINLESNASPTVFNKPSSKPKKEIPSNADTFKKDLAVIAAVNKNSSNYYNLPGRKIKVFPNPIYTCPSKGKIVVNITVDNIGKVIETSYNQASSTSENGCLIESALKYAKDAIFTNSSNLEQIGTITYIFQGQRKN